ncbi:hypothetical protein TW85_04250 [Marinomonas sp. S3726]|uniref:Fic family protein n=1 Tax=Marinomonas sp. S3726 TaxID=579484 RepID=UPI0005F9BA18|nr:Fic family protein [Marinomonas sp. S3726]KJZ16078.1 hypothetical protein TW85_04250 [Marinomonas sp. S3726]
MKKKVFGVEIPPKRREEELSSLPGQLWGEISPKKYGFDSKGNYLSWDEFIPRNKHLKEHLQPAWFLLKFKRNLEQIEEIYAFDESGDVRFVEYSPSSLMAKIHKIEMLSSLKHLELEKGNRQGFLSASLIMEEAINSAQLEGAATTRPVAKEMLSTNREPRNFSEQMILNNYHLMNYSKSVINETLSIELIQTFNQVATIEVCENEHTPGMIRDEAITVTESEFNETIHFAPDSAHINKMLESLCEFANKEHQDNDFIHPIVKAIILHFMIGYIHPFLDGNGRTARALFYWFMLKSGYDNFQYISISALLKSSKKKYARAFIKSENDEFDLTHFIDFNMNIIIRSLEGFTLYIQNKIEEIQKLRLEIHKSPYFNEFKFQHITIIKKAFEDPGREFTVKEWQTEFNVSATAARRYLDRLVELGILVKTSQKGRQLGYLAPRNLKQRLKLD